MPSPPIKQLNLLVNIDVLSQPLLYRKIQNPDQIWKQEKKEEDNNHTGTVFLQDSDLPKNNQNGIRSSDICLVPVRAIGDTVLNVMCGSIYAKGKKAEIEENNRAAIASRNSADISKQMMLGKSTAEKL